MLLYILLLAAGFIIQLLMMTAWPGAIFLVCATVLNLVIGYDSRVRLKSFDIDSRWTDVDIERIYEVERLDDRITKWNTDALDISNALGVVVFLLAAAGVAVVSMLLTTLSSSMAVGIIFITDAVILILPLWFNGTRTILKQDNLRVKISIIREMELYFRTISKEGETFKPALMLARDNTGKSVPTDTRFTISFGDMPADFYGVQAQININVVQGASYPYFYCVIPAKNGFGLKEYISKIPKRNKVIIEFQNEQNAEVIVIRHTTTKNSGYHTKSNTCKSILEVALLAARLILEAK
jgi:membrane protein YdbS with pleckstrin-like domain